MHSYDAIKDLKPRMVEKFLALTGWNKEEERADVSQLWINHERNAQIFLPLDDTYRDFGARFSEALRGISIIHQLRGEALGLEIMSAGSDILLLRADQATVDGTIPLLEAQRLLDGAQKLVTSAACTTINPRASIKGRRPNRVNDFVEDSVRMGHTLRGSFALSIFATIDERSEGGASDTKAEAAEKRPRPFARQVFSNLASALNASNGLLRNDQWSQESLNIAVKSGVSAELLESLEEMAKNGGFRSLDMRFKWSPLEPTTESEVTFERTTIHREAIDRAEPIVESLKRKALTKPTSMIGHVTRLERDPYDKTGIAVIEGVFNVPEITSRTLRVPLAGGQYRAAIRAHSQRFPVVVEGVIEKSGRSYETIGRVKFRKALDDNSATSNSSAT